QKLIFPTTSSYLPFASIIFISFCLHSHRQQSTGFVFEYLDATYNIFSYIANLYIKILFLLNLCCRP
ncbi:hypothetical protein BY996DRAFT_7307886, partial [Phakopsora pachyrhizi]